MELKLHLSLGEVNTVLAALETLPYGQVANLVVKVRAQAQVQLQAAQKGTDDGGGEGSTAD